MMRYRLILLWVFLGSLAACRGCQNKDNPSPTTLIAVWRPGTVQLNGTGLNLADVGQPYANFTLTLQGNDTGGNYTITGTPTPFPASFSGSWRKDNTTIVLSGNPSTFGNLTNVQLQSNNTRLSFEVNQRDDKTGNLRLVFNLIRQ